MDLGLIALATLVTFGRVLLLMFLSIVSGWGLAYLAISSRRFENFYVPLVNIFESIPVISFLPIVLIIFIQNLGGPIGVEMAADFLVFDAVVWNIWIGAYQAFKTVPGHLLEVSENYNFSLSRKLKDLYIPHSIPRLTSNLFASFADALFYITVSEVFVIGVTTYRTFGIGTLLAGFIEQQDLVGVFYSLLFIAVGVVGMTLVFIRLSRWGVARFGVDTEAPIKHHPGVWRTFRNKKWRTLRPEPGVVPKQFVMSELKRDWTIDASEEKKRHKYRKFVKYLVLALFFSVLSYLIFSIFLIASGVSGDQWNALLANTPYLLLAMGADYLRVALITLAALALAISLGYYIAVHHRVGRILAPMVQVMAAFPAPAYFPLVYIISLPFLSSVLPSAYTEVYIFLLGFLSCFYYVLFDFWVGVQAISSQFWDITHNYEIGFFTRMKRVILPATFPYLITGLSSTINSAWAGLMIGEYWQNIYGTHTLQTNIGMMNFISFNLSNGNLTGAVWGSLIFAIVVAFYSILFTRRLMDLARKKYVVEEGVYQA